MNTPWIPKSVLPRWTVSYLFLSCLFIFNLCQGIPNEKNYIHLRPIFLLFRISLKNDKSNYASHNEKIWNRFQSKGSLTRQYAYSIVSYKQTVNFASTDDIIALRALGKNRLQSIYWKCHSTVGNQRMG